VPNLDWRSLVDGMSNVQKLVHLAARMDAFDEDQWRVDLMRQRRRAYEAELAVQAAHVGCPGRVGRVAGGAVLNRLNEMSRGDAESIANTYNYYLAAAIIRVGQEKPRANRFVYAKGVRDWSPGYWAWKRPQIDEMTDNTARAMAQQDFYRQNGAFGSARLLPTQAVCPICQGWVARDVVPLRVALNNPPPYHVNCPHVWETDPDRVAREDCPNLWMGE
jgi:hypothetical protein